METVRLSDYSSYDKNKGGIQKLRHKFRNQILEYWGEDTGILIGITMVILQRQSCGINGEGF